MVVAMLALGIGVNSALFSVIDAVLLRPLEYKEPGQLFALLQTPKGGSVAAANMADYRTCSAFAGLASHEWRGFNLSGDGPPERILANGVSANYLQVLGIQPILGRDFLPEEDASGKNGVAIALWSTALIAIVLYIIMGKERREKTIKRAKAKRPLSAKKRNQAD